MLQLTRKRRMIHLNLWVVVDLLGGLLVLLIHLCEWLSVLVHLTLRGLLVHLRLRLGGMSVLLVVVRLCRMSMQVLVIHVVGSLLLLIGVSTSEARGGIHL